MIRTKKIRKYNKIKKIIIYLFKQELHLTPKEYRELKDYFNKGLKERLAEQENVLRVNIKKQQKEFWSNVKMLKTK